MAAAVTAMQWAGYRIVPVEPTREMLAAGQDEIDEATGSENVFLAMIEKAAAVTE